MLYRRHGMAIWQQAARCGSILQCMQAELMFFPSWQNMRPQNCSSTSCAKMVFFQWPLQACGCSGCSGTAAALTSSWLSSWPMPQAPRHLPLARTKSCFLLGFSHDSGGLEWWQVPASR